MPNRIVPEKLKRDVRLAQAERACRGAREFFLLLFMSVDNYSRFTAIPKALNGELYPVELVEIRHTDIARRLAACEKAGLLSVHEDPNGPWLELNLDLCYRRSEAKQPKYGPRLERAASQAEFPMLYEVSAEFVENPSAHKKGARQKTGSGSRAPACRAV